MGVAARGFALSMHPETARGCRKALGTVWGSWAFKRIFPLTPFGRYLSGLTGGES